jgi:hypothetical protein
MNTFDDDTDLGFFDEQATREGSSRPRRRTTPQRGGGPRRPLAPPPGAVGLARLAGLVALAIVVVVALVFWVGSCQGGSKHDEYASYLGKIQPLAQDSAKVGSEFASELSAAKLTLQTFESKLEGWSRAEQLDYAAAARLQPPGPLQAAQQEALAAFQLREVGLAGLAETIAQAQAKSPTPTAATVAADLAAEAQLLSASDVVWTQLFKLPATGVLLQVGVRGVIVPGSLFVANPDVISERSFSIVYQRLSTPTNGNGAPTGTHGSALVSVAAVSGGTTTTLSTSTPETIAASSGLVIRVTFEDSGNFPEVQIPVTLKVNVSGNSVYSKTQLVSQVLAHQQASTDFTNLQVPPAAFGHRSQITVQIGKVPGEVRLDNNSATYPVFFSLAP